MDNKIDTTENSGKTSILTAIKTVDISHNGLIDFFSIKSYNNTEKFKIERTFSNG